MIACFCGGFLEIGYFAILTIVSISGSIFGTNWYNKARYKKYIQYKNKHNNCVCDCHKEDDL
jgi:hypothetical protein